MSEPDAFVLFLVAPGPRPPYRKVADALWGEGSSVDTDGNSRTPDDLAWTELTVTLRTGDRRDEEWNRVDVDPVSESPLVSKIHGKTAELVRRSADFLAATTGGVLRDSSRA